MTKKKVEKVKQVGGDARKRTTAKAQSLENGDDVWNERHAVVAAYHRRGMTQFEIRELTGIALLEQDKILRKVRDGYKNSAVGTYHELVQEKLDQYRDIRSEAWKAWELSKKDKEKVVEAESNGANGMTSAGTQRTVEGRLPDSAYLRVIMDTLGQECKLLGLDVADPQNVTQIQINWGDLAKVDGRATVPDLLENKIAALENLPCATDQNVIDMTPTDGPRKT